jgi:hypothetical protein
MLRMINVVDKNCRENKICRTMLGFCLWGWMESEVYKIILDSVAHVKKHEDQLRPTARDLRIKLLEVDGGILVHLF